VILVIRNPLHHSHILYRTAVRAGAQRSVTDITAPHSPHPYTQPLAVAHFTQESQFPMAYVITDTCIKDALCVDVCPTDCVHPKKDEPEFEAATQMYVDPAECIDCGACLPVCTSDSIYAVDDVPEDKNSFVEKNAAFFKH
jgi:ferredoxin